MADIKNIEKFNYKTIPLSVIEDIKAEIKAEWQADMYDDKFGVADCLKIIDKHISGK